MTRAATAWSVTIRTGQPLFIAGAVPATVVSLRGTLWIAAVLLAGSALLQHVRRRLASAENMSRVSGAKPRLVAATVFRPRLSGCSVLATPRAGSPVLA